MMRIFLFLMIVACPMAKAFAQQHQVTFQLQDSVNHQSLKSATVGLLKAEDSTIITTVLAEDRGIVHLNHLSSGHYLLHIQFSGYAPVFKKLSLTTSTTQLDLGKIFLNPIITTLNEVTVQQSPVTIKKDTVEYHAGSYKTKPNAVVEDLLKKLPGVTVAKDGTVTAHGEQVQRILVDGKRFFGDDPKMATKNLPPDIVDKIQVYDAMSDQSSFSGFDDGSRTKTINITIKKDKRKGVFGKASVAAGNQDRRENSVNLSKYNNGQQISLLAQDNNVNRQAFTMQDFLGTNNRGGGNGGGRGGNGNNGNNNNTTNNNNGIATTQAGGINYKDVWGKKTDVSGSYFYNHVQTNKNQNSLTQNILPSDSSIFNNQLSNSYNNNYNHRFNYNIESQPDSNYQLIVRPNLSLQKTNSNNNTNNDFYKTKSVLTSNTSQNTFNSNSGINANIDATLRRRLKRKGQTFSVNINASVGTNDGNGSNLSNLLVNGLAKNINQINNSSQNSYAVGTNVSYTHPIANNQQIEFSYNINYRNNQSQRTVNAYNSTSTNFDMLVDSLSNHFENIYFSQRVGLGYRLQRPKYNFNFSNGVQFAQLNSHNISKHVRINPRFINLFPTAQLNYQFSKNKNLRINYNGRTNQPNVNQLQPVIDNSNQVNIKLGNPNLSQEFAHNLQVRLGAFNTSTFNNTFVFATAGLTQHKIVNDVTQLNNGNQITSYQNKNGTYNASVFFYRGFQLKKPKSNINFTTNISYNRDISVLNQKNSYTKTTTIGETIGWTMNLKERFDLVFSTTATFNMVRYNLLPQNNVNYFTHLISAEPTYTFKSGWVVAADFDYTYNTGRAAGYNITVPLLNASIAKQLFKKKEGEIKLAVYDLFNQNQSVTRTTTGNTITDVQTLVLKQYFLLSFTYQLRKFAGAPPSKQEGNYPPGMRGMMRQMYRNGGGGRNDIIP